MLFVEQSSEEDQRQQGRRAREQVDALYRFWHTRQVASAFAAIIRRLGASAWRGLSRPLGKFISVQPAKAPTFRYSSTPGRSNTDIRERKSNGSLFPRIISASFTECAINYINMRALMLLLICIHTPEIFISIIIMIRCCRILYSIFYKYIK